ncbi:MAG: ribosome recycling factor [Candidatus Berkelbacteria bacterium]|nr:ribosome recycling factor [Candidatus Berkelbacteria bacterium]
MYQNEIKNLKVKFDQVIEKLKEDFVSIRTGRASTGLVENIMVSYYGTITPLKQMASLTTPDAAQIVVIPWDKNSIGDIELAIRNSDLGLSPVNDGKSVRIILPQMTQERREELTKNISRKSEEARVALRNVRGDAWDKIKKMEKDGLITEDDRYSAEEELNKVIDEHNKKIGEILEAKEKEIKAI